MPDPAVAESAVPDSGGRDSVVPDPDPPRAPEPMPGLWPALAGYTALRVLLVAVLTALLSLFMPLIVALLFAIVLQLPLAWMLFGGPRRRLTAALAARTADRQAERDRLRRALGGE